MKYLNKYVSLGDELVYYVYYLTKQGHPSQTPHTSLTNEML